MADCFEVDNVFFYALFQSREHVYSAQKNPKNYYMNLALKIWKTCFFLLPSLFQSKNRHFWSYIDLGQEMLTFLQNVDLWRILLRLVIFFHAFYQSREHGQSFQKTAKNYYMNLVLKVWKTCFFCFLHFFKAKIAIFGAIQIWDRYC